MLTNGHDHHPPKFLQIKQDDKFFSKLLAKEESSKNNESSFRVSYYGGSAGAVPFTWESQPGTPKHTLSCTSLPPLTPPPSYKLTPQMKSTQKRSKSKIMIESIFPRMGSKKTNVSPLYSSSSMSSSCSSSYSLPSTPMNNIPFTSRSKLIPRSRSAIYFGVHEDDDNVQQPAASSRTTTFCFGGRSTGNRRRSIGHYHPGKNLRKAFLSIVGQ